MAKQDTPIRIPAFPGRALIAAQASYDKQAQKAAAKFSDNMRVLFNSWLDAVRAAGLDKSEAGCTALRKAILEQEDIARALREGLWTRDTLGNYAQGAMRAFYHGAEWSPRAFQAEDKGGLPALPWSKAPAKKAKPGAQLTPKDKHAAPADAITGPADAMEARKFIRGQLNTLTAYGNKHAKLLDLQTRDVLAQLAKLAETIGKIDAAPF